MKILRDMNPIILKAKRGLESHTCEHVQDVGCHNYGPDHCVRKGVRRAGRRRWDSKTSSIVKSVAAV